MDLESALKHWDQKTPISDDTDLHWHKDTQVSKVPLYISDISEIHQERITNPPNT